MRLKELRQSNNLTQAQLADKLGCNQTAIGKYERGDLQPSIETLFKLADIFGCSIDYLLGREDDFGNVSVNANADLTAEEKTMLELFNKLPEVRRRTVIDTMRFMVESNNQTATQNKKFHA